MNNPNNPPVFAVINLTIRTDEHSIDWLVDTHTEIQWIQWVPLWFDCENCSLWRKHAKWPDRLCHGLAIHLIGNRRARVRPVWVSVLLIVPIRNWSHNNWANNCTWNCHWFSIRSIVVRIVRTFDLGRRKYWCRIEWVANSTVRSHNFDHKFSIRIPFHNCAGCTSCSGITTKIVRRN